MIGVAVTPAVAWSAVHSYTGPIFTTVGVFISIPAGLFFRGERARAARSAAVIAFVVALLQVSLVVYRCRPARRGRRWGGHGSVGRILTGQARPEFAGSWNGFSAAFTFIQGAPWHQHGWSVWILAAGAIIVAARHRRDPALLAVTILPLTLAVMGYAFFVGPAYEAYYYLSLMPAAVLTVLLGLTAMSSRQSLEPLPCLSR